MQENEVCHTQKENAMPFYTGEGLTTQKKRLQFTENTIN